MQRWTVRYMYCNMSIGTVYSGIWLLFHPGSNNNKKGGNKIVVLPFFVAKNVTKFKNILFLNRCSKKFEPVDKKLSLDSEIWVGDPRSRIRKKPFPGGGGVKKAPDPGSRIRYTATISA